MKNKILISLSTFILLSLNLNSYEIKESDNEIKKKSSFEEKFIEDNFDFNNKEPEGIGYSAGASASASVSWSLVNENCEFDPKVMAADSLDRYVNILEGTFKNIKDNLPMLLKNYGITYGCETIATQTCEVLLGYTDYMDDSRVNAEVSDCMTTRGKGVLTVDTSATTGVVFVGCNVPPGVGASPLPVPVYPYMANPTTAVVPCPGPTVPMGTPIPFPEVTVDSNMEVDAKSMGIMSKCYPEVYAKYKGDAVKECKKQTKEKCFNFLKGTAQMGIDFGMDDFNLQKQSCILDQQYTDASLKKFIDDQLEGKKLPNNKKIENGKIVIDDKNVGEDVFGGTKEENEYLKKDTKVSFKNKINTNMEELKDIADQQEDSEKLLDLENKKIELYKESLDFENISGGDTSGYDMPNKYNFNKHTQYDGVEKTSDKIENSKISSNKSKTESEISKERDEFVLEKLEDIDKKILYDYEFQMIRYSIYMKYINKRNKIAREKYEEGSAFDDNVFIQYPDQLDVQYDKIMQEKRAYTNIYKNYLNYFSEITKSINNKIMAKSKQKRDENKNSNGINSK